MSEVPRFSGKAPIRVFLVDDHEVVRRGVHDLLDAEPGVEVVGEAESARQVDPGGELPPDLRREKALHARKAYMLQLAFRSSRVRGRTRPGT